MDKTAPTMAMMRSQGTRRYRPVHRGIQSHYGPTRTAGMENRLGKGAGGAPFPIGVVRRLFRVPAGDQSMRFGEWLPALERPRLTM